MTPEDRDHIRQIAAEAAREAATEAAKEAVRETLTALGFDLDRLHEEQQVLAFNRMLYNSMRRSWFAFITGVISAVAAAIVGYVIYWLTGKHL